MSIVDDSLFLWYFHTFFKRNLYYLGALRIAQQTAIQQQLMSNYNQPYPYTISNPIGPHPGLVNPSPYQPSYQYNINNGNTIRPNSLPPPYEPPKRRKSSSSSDTNQAENMPKPVIAQSALKTFNK